MFIMFVCFCFLAGIVVMVVIPSIAPLVFIAMVVVWCISGMYRAHVEYSMVRREYYTEMDNITKENHRHSR